MGDKLLSAENVSKDYSSVRVLYSVDFDVLAGEVHAVIGENGAGKSTLVKTISGYHKPTEGKIFLEGQELSFADIAEGEESGIIMIHQELNLAPDLTVEENIFLGQELKGRLLLNEEQMRQEVEEILQELDCDISPQARIKDLSISDQQMVEIAKAVRKKAKIIIMDEPTSSLTSDEVKVLFAMIKKLKQEQVGVIFISHKLDEVKEIADRVTVLRDGEHVETGPVENFTEEEMANLMVGRELQDMYPTKVETAQEEIALEAKNFVVPGYVKTASFKLKKNEILGFAGLVGAGRTELLEAVVGLRERSQGEVYKYGDKIVIDTYLDSLKHKIAYLSEDRKDKTLLIRKALPMNLTLMALKKYADPFINEQKELEAFKDAEEKFSIQTPGYDVIADKLSGGNQQKLGVAKLMEAEPEIIIFDEPTRGIDVGTKQQLYAFIKELVTEEDKSCIFISSELQEVIGLCTRVVVMSNGQIAGTVTGDDINEETIMQYATGLKGVV
ncbi:MAG: sugar ABC transporter ATP-binding protein [Thermodesulfobacteriota bacterium]